MPTSTFFDGVVFLLSSLVNDSNFMSIWLLVLELWQFLSWRNLTRNLEIGNTPACVLSNIWRKGWVRNTKFGMNVPNKKLFNHRKYQIDKFYCFSVIKEKNIRQGWVGVTNTSGQIIPPANQNENVMRYVFWEKIQII